MQILNEADPRLVKVSLTDPEETLGPQNSGRNAWILWQNAETPGKGRDRAAREGGCCQKQVSCPGAEAMSDGV